MQWLEQVSQFYVAHGLESGSVTSIGVDDGAVLLADVGEHRWAVSFYPHRSDHPDAPVVHVQVGEDELGGGTDADAAEAWARERFEGRDPREFVLVYLEEEADPRDVELVESLFDAARTPAIVRPAIGRRSADVLPWLIVLKAAVTAFAVGFLGKAGGDSWNALKSVVERLYEARRESTGRDGTVALEDGGRSIVLVRNLPDEAYRALEDLPPEGYFVWDASEQRWRQH